MTYSILGQNLHETADRAKLYFAQTYGAKKFVCEQELDPALPLKPTWQAALSMGYKLCLEVRETPFSPTLYQFVMECSRRGMPVRLWVVVPKGPPGATFNSELKQAREVGVGVAEIGEDGSPQEFHQPVALSLFGLKKTELKAVPPVRREALKAAEDTFLLAGAPDQGCQKICQELEDVTRLFAAHTYQNGFWKMPSAAKSYPTRFFTHDSWTTMLDVLATRIDDKAVKKRCPHFTAAKLAGARHYTDWRNSVSHKPKTLAEVRKRDAKLRTMFEATRDLLIEWYEIAKPFRLIK